MQLYEAVGIERGDKSPGAQTRCARTMPSSAPRMLQSSRRRRNSGAYGALDCGGFITAFCLSAQAQGIATIPQAALAFYSDQVRAFISTIPEDQLVLAAISFGYEDPDHPANNFRTERASSDEMVIWHED